MKDVLCASRINPKGNAHPIPQNQIQFVVATSVALLCKMCLMQAVPSTTTPALAGGAREVITTVNS
jgi:hypothetical protein